MLVLFRAFGLPLNCGLFGGSGQLLGHLQGHIPASACPAALLPSLELLEPLGAGHTFLVVAVDMENVGRFLVMLEIEAQLISPGRVHNEAIRLPIPIHHRAGLLVHLDFK